MYTNTYYDVDEKIMHIFPSPNDLMLSLLSQKMVSSNPRLGRDQGPDIIAKRLLLLDGYLEDAAKSFRELREVQVLHILARQRGADAPNLLFHRTKEAAATGFVLKGHRSSQFW